MATSVETDARRGLYDRYLSTHFGAMHPPSLETLEWDRRVWRDYFRRFLPKNKTARLLDLACGFGSFLYFLRREGYANACGVDVSREQVEAAWKLGIENVLHGEGREFLENHQDEFDCVTAFDLLEHLTKGEVLSLLRAIHAALKPGGLLVLRTANADGPFGATMLHTDFTHELAFTPTSIRQVLTATGFERVEIHPEGPRVHGLVSAARWIAWKGIRLLLLVYLAAETGRVRGHVLTQNLIAVARKSDVMVGTIPTATGAIIR